MPQDAPVSSAATASGPATGSRPGADAIVGLTERDAARRLAVDGPNLLAVDQRRGLAALAGEVVREPMFLLLLGAGAVYLLMGERNEALDCRVYARAAAWILGADRWSDARWLELERQLAVEVSEAAGDGLEKAKARPSAQRRTMRSNYMR